MKWNVENKDRKYMNENEKEYKREIKITMPMPMPIRLIMCPPAMRTSVGKLSDELLS